MTAVNSLAVVLFFSPKLKKKEKKNYSEWVS